MQALVKIIKMLEMKKEGGEMHKELGETMKMMMDKTKAVTMSGNTDKDFVMMMILQHEGAVSMAKNEISHGKQLELKKMARKRINDQTKEIKDLNAWLASKK